MCVGERERECKYIEKIECVRETGEGAREGGRERER